MTEKEMSISDAGQRDQRIKDLLPEMHLRYQRLKAVLDDAGAGRDVSDSELWLAQNDLYGVLAVMVQDPDDDRTLLG